MPHASGSAIDSSVDARDATPPASNLRIPRPGAGFVWPPSYWNDSNIPLSPAMPEAPPATPAPNEPTDSLPYMAMSGG
jgi:hypothetical protein